MHETDTRWQVAARHQVSVRQVALNWLLHHTPNVLPSLGTTNLAHLAENIQALRLYLAAADVQALDALRH